MKQVTSLQEIETAIDDEGEIVVSKNSKNNVIIMSIEEYKQKLLETKMEESLLMSEEDYKNGRVRKAEEVFREWEEKYGI